METKKVIKLLKELRDNCEKAYNIVVDDNTHIDLSTLDSARTQNLRYRVYQILSNAIKDVKETKRYESGGFESAKAKEALLEDVVNHPRHYKGENGIECIDAMEAAFGKEAVKIFCKCNAFKYLFRSNIKEPDTSLQKAAWYLDKYHQLNIE